MESSSFLSLSVTKEEGKCLICNKTVERKDKIHCFGVNDWPKSKEQAEKSSKFKIHKDSGTEEPFEKSHRSCKREFDLRYTNSATIFGEKNPTETGKFLSVVFLVVIISERKFLELLSVNIRNKFSKNGICVLPSFRNKKIYGDEHL